MHPVIEFLQNQGYKLVNLGKEVRTSAKYRGGNNPSSLAICTRTGKWIDWGVPDTHGKAEDLVKIITGEIRDFGGWNADIEVDTEKFKPMKKSNNEVLEALLPDWPLFTKRGISDKTMKTFEAGLCMSGKLRKRVIFPIRNRNNHEEIIGLAGRWFAEKPPDGTAPWKILGPKKDFIFGCNVYIDAPSDTVIIVESIGDALRLFDNGIHHVYPIFGLKLSEKLLLYILSLSPKNIIIATNNEPDNDSQGNKAAQKIFLKLRNFFDERKIIIFLPFAKDFGEMDTFSVKKWNEQLQIKIKNIDELI